ncbi:MAG: hypothetical protein K6L80_08010 [Agarilytica sp.]
MKLNTINNILLACVLVCVSKGVFAENRFLVETGAGLVDVNNGDYQKGYALDSSIAYENGLIYRLGVARLKDISPHDSRYQNDSELEVSGWYAGVSKPIYMDRLGIELGLGVFEGKTEATFFGRKLASETDMSPYADLKLLVPVNDLVTVYGDVKYLDNLSGGDIYILSAGARFSF